MVSLGLRSMWLELREEIGGPMVWVVFVGAIGPLAVGLALGESSWWLFPIPIPLAVASAAARVSDRSGPAISLGALLGYLLVIALMASPLYPPLYEWAVSGYQLAPSVRGVPLSCRACSPPPFFFPMLSLLLAYACSYLGLLLAAAWLLISSYPAYVARFRFRRVPRLLLIAYASALAIDSCLSASCASTGWMRYAPWLLAVSSALDATLAVACLWKARKGGGRDLLTFLTFYLLSGSVLRYWWW